MEYENVLENLLNTKSIPMSTFKIIEGPSSFFEIIKFYLKTSDSVSVCTLYFGSKQRDEEIFKLLSERQKNKRYTRVIIDSDRTMEENDSFEKFKKFGINNLISVQKKNISKLLPFFLREMIQVQHSKMYIFDDNVIISGANLGNRYFTNIVDRYFLIKNKELAADLLEIVGRKHLCAHVFNPNDHFKNFSEKKNDGDFEKKIDLAEKEILYPDYLKNGLETLNNIKNTSILNFTETSELSLLNFLFSQNFKEIYISTAYINFPDEYFPLLNKKNVKIFLPSKKSNTFNGASFYGNMVANSYSYSIYRTKKLLPNANFFIFDKKNYSFHKKGIWFINEKSVVSFCGSSNYNVRSTSRDMELNHVILTEDKDMISSFISEIKFLEENSTFLKKNVWRNCFYFFRIFFFFMKSFM